MGANDIVDTGGSKLASAEKTNISYPAGTVKLSASGRQLPDE